MSEGVLVSLISAAGIVVVGGLTLVGVIYQSNKTRNQMDTGNGHTIGQGVARIEETQWRHEGRLDSIEVELREAREKVEEAKAGVEMTHILSHQAVQQMEDHLLEIQPLREWAERKRREEGLS